MNVRTESLSAGAIAAASERGGPDPFVADVARLLLTFFSIVVIDLVVVSLMTQRLRCGSRSGWTRSGAPAPTRGSPDVRSPMSPDLHDARHLPPDRSRLRRAAGARGALRLWAREPRRLLPACSAWKARSCLSTTSTTGVAGALTAVRLGRSPGCA